jgi:hypothetical protein
VRPRRPRRRPARGRRFQGEFPWPGAGASALTEGTRWNGGEGSRRVGVGTGDPAGEPDDDAAEEPPCERDRRPDGPEILALSPWAGPPVPGEGLAPAVPVGRAEVVTIERAGLVMGSRGVGIWMTGSPGRVPVGSWLTGTVGRVGTTPESDPEPPSRTPLRRVVGEAVAGVAVLVMAETVGGVAGTETGTGRVGGIPSGRVAAEAGWARTAERTIPRVTAPTAARRSRRIRRARLISNNLNSTTVRVPTQSGDYTT